MEAPRRLIVSLLVVAAFGGLLYMKKRREDAGTVVDIVVVEKRGLRPSILASGTLAYQAEVMLTAEVLARIKQIAVKEGDVVQAGQLLVKLDPQSYNHAINREGATLAQARIDIARKKEAFNLREKQLRRGEALAAEQLISQDTLDEARDLFLSSRSDLLETEQALRRAEAVVSEALEQKSKTEIRSPIAGTVISILIKVGETAIPSTSALPGALLMKIADTSTLEAELKVDEADIGKVRLGQSAQITPASFPSLVIDGKIQMIALDPTVEGLGRAYKVTSALTNDPGLGLRSGMSVRADILTGDGKAYLTVPVASVLNDADERGRAAKYVWVLKGRLATKRAIKTSVSDDQWESVIYGLEVGEQVIAGPAKVLHTLREGERVAPSAPAALALAPK